MDIQLQPGKVYQIHHRSKGVFIAKLIDIIEGDEADEVFLHVLYDVRAGTDQERLAIVPGKGRQRESNLRPSKITKIEEYEGETWLREMNLPRKVKPTEAATSMKAEPEPRRILGIKLGRRK